MAAETTSTPTWKKAVIRRLKERNLKENDPVYSKMFQLLDKNDRKMKATSLEQMESLHRQNHEMEMSLKLAEAQLSERRTTCDHLKAKLEQCERDKAQVERQLEEMNLKLERLGIVEQESEEYQQQLKQTQAELEQKCDEIDKLNKVVETCRSECDAMKDTIESLSDKLLKAMYENSQKSYISRTATTSNPEDGEQAGQQVKARSKSTVETPVDAAATVVVPELKYAFRKLGSFFKKSFDDSAQELADGAGADYQHDDSFQMIDTPEISFCGLPTRLAVHFAAHKSECTAVKWGPNSRLLATGGSDRSINIWSVDSTSSMSTSATAESIPMLSSFATPSNGFYGIEFDSSESLLACACVDKMARIFSLPQKRQILVLSGHSEAVTAIRFGNCLHGSWVTGSRDGTIRFWDQSGYVIRTLPIGSRVNDLVNLNGGGYTMASGHADRSVKLWDRRLDCRNSVNEIKLSDRVACLDTTSANIHQILAMTKDATIHLLDWRLGGSDRGSVVRTFTNEGFITNFEMARACFSPDGTYIAAGSMVGPKTGSLHVWETLTGKVSSCIASFAEEEDDPRNAIVAVHWQPNGRAVAGVDRHGRCLIWSG